MFVCFCFSKFERQSDTYTVSNKEPKSPKSVARHIVLQCQSDELISKYNVGLKTLLSEGLSEPEFYGDLVYKFKKLIGSNDFSFQFRKS